MDTKMKTITITNQKGGVGKTTLVINLAQFATIEHKYKVAVIDLDTQGNASWTLASDVIANTGNIFFDNKIDSLNASRDLNVISSDYRLANIEKIDVEQIAYNLKAIQKKLQEQNVDLFIIDTPPSMGNALVSSLLVADYVLCPIELEAFSLQGVHKMRNVINNIRTINSDLTELGLLPSRVENRNATHRRQLLEIQQSFPQLICPYSIFNRSSIADAVSERTWIGNNKKTCARKAAHELSDVTNWILQRIELA